MYQSNLKARNYLLYTIGCSDVWFKRHTRRKDKTFTPDGFYPSTDLFNLFDGVALNQDKIIFFQVKTNGWPPAKPLEEFAETYGASVMAINIRKKKNIWITDVRKY